VQQISMQPILSELRQIGISYVHYEKKLKSTRMFLSSKREKLSEKYIKPLEDEVKFYEFKLNELLALAAELFEEFPLWTEWLSYVKGFSLPQFLKLIAFVDFEKARHPSSIWMYLGIVDPTPLPEKIIDPNTGKEVIIKDANGRLIRYNRAAKSALFIQGISFLGWNPSFWNRLVNKPPRINGGYARLYSRFRNATDQKHPDWSATHRFLDALRKMLKVYTAHLFIVYCWLEYKIAEVHYAVAKLHQNYIYMPVIDSDEKPEWWWKLREKYIEAGVKPVEP